MKDTKVQFIMTFTRRKEKRQKSNHDQKYWRKLNDIRDKSILPFQYFLILNSIVDHYNFCFKDNAEQTAKATNAPTYPILNIHYFSLNVTSTMFNILLNTKGSNTSVICTNSMSNDCFGGAHSMMTVNVKQWKEVFWGSCNRLVEVF